MSDAALITGMLSNTIPLIKDEYLLSWCSNKEIEKLSTTLSRINAVLKDAETKKLEEKDNQAKDWLRKVNDLAYKVRDIMDECTTEELRLQVQMRNSSIFQVTNFFANLFSNTRTTLHIGHKLKNVQQEIDQSYSQCQELGLCETRNDTKCNKNAVEMMKMAHPSGPSSLISKDDDCWLLFERSAFQNGTPKTPNLIDIGREIAKKCKGVPLVANILGSQLSFKDDEIEWCKIRDNKMWVISQNENSILPILRMSYYDLPYHLRRCFAYCAIFPKCATIHKEGLIQMWMAHDLIPKDVDQELEDVGNTIWNELCRRSFFQDKTETTCKMHDLIHDLAQDVMEGECCIMGSRSSSYVSELQIRHITVMVNKNLEKAPFLYPNKIGSDKSLQSIVLYHSNFHSLNVLNEIFSDMKKHCSLRVLQVHPDVANIVLRNVGCLKHLRYLNLSYSRIEALPDSICELFNLQTLNLIYCTNLTSLPRNTQDLISLRHLYLEGCSELQYMPVGIGQLKLLKTLSLFVIGKETDHCKLDELKELDIRGSLGIMNMQRVSDTSIASWKISFAAKKLSINKLELQWSFNEEDNETKKRHEQIGETLEVPTTGLKILKVSGYQGMNLPKLVKKSSAFLTYLELWYLKNLNHIFTINDNDDNGMMAFPLLEKLEIRCMTNLTELFSPNPSPNCIARAFPNVREIEIFYCPKLRALPPHFKSLKDVTLSGDCSDELLYSISNLSGLTHLSLCVLNRKVLFPAKAVIDPEIPSSTYLIDNNEAQGQTTFQSLQHLKIMWSFMLSCLFDEGTTMQLSSLQSLYIRDCKQLMSLGGKATRGAINLNSLTKLHIEDCPELMISFEEFEILLSNSLQSLYIKNCPKLVSSEEAEDVIALFRQRLGHINFNVDFLKEGEEGKEPE